MGSARPLLLLTRPLPASQAFWEALPAAAKDSVDLVINPLLSIRVKGRLPSLDRATGLIFTSANAVKAYVELGGTPHLPAIAVGEGTATAAAEFGFDVNVAGGNADRLVSYIVDQGYNGPLIHLRGQVAIGDVAARLTNLGVTTTEAVLYEQKLEEFSSSTKEALSQDRVMIAPVFSPRTARQLWSESGGAKNMVFAAISKAVAETLPSDAVSRTRVAVTPNRVGMVDLVTEMILDAAEVERQ